MKVVALFRVSTEKQESEGTSLETQQKHYRDHAARCGWTTVAEFKGCESATQAVSDRRVLQDVLACIRDRAPDAVYVHEQSRLTRGDELEVAMLMRELKERRLKIIVNGVVRDLGSLDERFMVGIQSLVDRAESERIKERLVRGKRERARQGKIATGAAPYGYENPLPGQEGRGKLRIVPAEAAVVRKIFALSGAGKGDMAIAAELNGLGVPASRGGRWGKSSIRAVLKNHAYLGVLASGVWKADPGTRRFRFDLKREGAIVIHNAHQPIIEQADWDAVHSRAKLPRTHVPRLLTELLYVDGLRYGSDSGAQGGYYRAGRGVRGKAWLLLQEVDEKVWTAFCSLATSEAFVAKLMAEAANPNEQAKVAHEIEYLEGHIAKLQRRLDNLVDLRADGDILKAEFDKRSDAARAAIAAAETELRGLRARVVAADGTTAERIVRAVRLLLPCRTVLTHNQKRTILRTLVRRVDVTAVPTGAKQARVEGGKLAASGGPRWAVGKVELRLALPPKDAVEAAYAAHAGSDAEPEAAGERRTGQLGTTFWPCGQVSEAEGVGESRHGQLGKASWDCGLVTVAVGCVGVG